MSCFYLSLALVAILIVASPESSAQTARGTQPAPTTPAAEQEPPQYEFTEAELPRYDQNELARNVRYPDDALRNGLEGTAVITFIIDTTGTPVRLEAVTSDHILFTEAAMDAIGRLRFTPGMQKGKPVAVRMTVPVRFSLSNE